MFEALTHWWELHRNAERRLRLVVWTEADKVLLNLKRMERRIMTRLEELNTAMDANEAATAALSAKIDLVITALHDLKRSGGATEAELEALLGRITADTAAEGAAADKVDAELAPQTAQPPATPADTGAGIESQPPSAAEGAAEATGITTGTQGDGFPVTGEGAAS